MIYTVTLPLPPKACSPNAHIHFRTQRKAQIGYKEMCAYLLIEAIQKGKLPKTLPPPITLHLDFYLCNKSPVPGLTYGEYMGVAMPRDADNARGSFKYGQDAFAVAGLIPDDGKRYVRLGETRLHTTASEHQGRSELVVTIETCEEGK